MPHDILAWLVGLPPLALYAALAVAAAIENVFPPFPADTVVAFGSFLAARGSATALGTFVSTWAGNVSGAMGVYWVGRRVGAGWLHRRLARWAGPDASRRLTTQYENRGMLALFLSRFVPAVRALVPPFAGAARMKPLPVFLIIATASAIWYGTISYLAYRVGADWDALRHAIAGVSLGIAIVAGVLLTLGVAWWLVHRRRREARR